MNYGDKLVLLDYDHGTVRITNVTYVQPFDGGKHIVRIPDVGRIVVDESQLYTNMLRDSLEPVVEPRIKKDREATND